MVREIFRLYRTYQSLVQVVAEVNRRGWRTKVWTTKAGEQRGGAEFRKGVLHRLLINPVYIGKVRHKGREYDGEHEGIVPPELFKEVQELISSNGRKGGPRIDNKYGALLKGILRCAHCDAAMVPASSRTGSRVYRYYKCTGFTEKGSDTCPTRYVSAPKIEQLVVDQIRHIGRDPALIKETAKQVNATVQTQKTALQAEQKQLKRNLAKRRSECRRLLDTIDLGKSSGPTITDRLAELEEHAQVLERRLAEIAHELDALAQQSFNQADLAAALESFDEIWEVLYPVEQARIVRLLVERVDYNGGTEKARIQFRPTGIQSLATDCAEAEPIPAE